MFIGFVGEMPPGKNSENGKHALYTHKSINVKYNKDQVCCFFAIKDLIFTFYVIWFFFLFA